MKDDTISRAAAIDAMMKLQTEDIEAYGASIPEGFDGDRAVTALKALPPAQPDADKYEYHYDHTDCIWYRPEARNRCPVTCAQYRDGWNDAMNYIFRDGQGYRPYRRDERYER